MRGIRKFIKSISGHKNFDPNYYSSEVLTMTNLVYSLFNFDFIFERQKKNGYGANKYRFFEEKLGVSFRIHFTLLLTITAAIIPPIKPFEDLKLIQYDNIKTHIRLKYF